MAHFWIQQSGEAGSGWAVQPLGGSAYQLLDREPFVRRAEAAFSPAGAELVVHVKDETADQWVLLLPPEARLRVNGHEALLGVLPLRDRDEIHLGNGQRLYFSTERLPRIVAFPGGALSSVCARCRSPIAPESQAVACPNCGAWCHQTEEMPCWRYAAHCPLCDQSTDPEASFRWMPDGL